MNITLGLTGSVATTLHNKLLKELSQFGHVDIIYTKSSLNFLDYQNQYPGMREYSTYEDKDEWISWEKRKEVLHINLRNKSSVLVIAPCSANTLAKLANGICDNLLTCVARAWDMNRPVIIAPSMNTQMWNHPTTKEHISKLEKWGYSIVYPQSKVLACKEVGMGALANIDDIVAVVKDRLQWTFPIWHGECKGIPVGQHPGAFLTKRKYHTHTGVDLYVKENTPVHAVERGKIISIEHFTGPSDNSPWWLDTDCILIEGASGVICYGEIIPAYGMEVGKEIYRGQFIGNVTPVLPPHKLRPDIDGHSVSMLHMEMYKHGKTEAFREFNDIKDDWDILIDPTPFLLNSCGAPERKFVHPKPENA